MHSKADWDQVSGGQLSLCSFFPTHTSAERPQSLDKNRLLTFFFLREAAWGVFAGLQPALIELGSTFLRPRMP